MKRGSSSQYGYKKLETHAQVLFPYGNMKNRPDKGNRRIDQTKQQKNRPDKATEE